MNFNEIKELTEWLEKSSFTAYSLTIDGVHISVSKQQAPPIQYFGHPSEVTHAPPLQLADDKLPVPTQQYDLNTDTDAHIISSPIVGIYYESANAESPAFVEVGQKVKKGDTLCILEAMKVMNTITADVDGTITEIFASNGSMVEACMPLFKILL